jgi:hypothetical protein
MDGVRDCCCDVKCLLPCECTEQLPKMDRDGKSERVRERAFF